MTAENVFLHHCGKIRQHPDSTAGEKPKWSVHCAGSCNAKQWIAMSQGMPTCYLQKIIHPLLEGSAFHLQRGFTT